MSDLYLFSQNQVKLIVSLFSFSQGVLALSGMNDDQAKPVLLCSCNDNSVRLYDLPS